MTGRGPAYAVIPDPHNAPAGALIASAREQLELHR